ncbi:MAG: ABC transporter ATP-binding protein [Halothiobacillaceae bacterium]
MSENIPEPLLRIEDLEMHWRDQGPALRNIRFSVGSGERVALVGESGSGKTITALSILRLLEDDQVVYTGGSIHYGTTDLLTLSERRMRALRGREIAMIFQEPMTALNPLQPIWKQVAEGLVLHEGLSARQAHDRAVELLERTGIPEPARRAGFVPHQLSGGQRQRAMIAMALACRPRLLIADEPTTALDVTLQGQIMDLLTELQEDFGMSLLLITHDLSLVENHADRVVVMRQGEIVEQGAVRSVFAAPKHEYTRMLLSARPVPLVDPTPPAPVDPPPLSVGPLAVTYGKPKGFLRPSTLFAALDGVSFSLQPGETLGIVGESGSGKSTLALALLRLVGSEGPVHLSGQSMEGLGQKRLRPLRRHLQVVFQDPFSALSPRMTVGAIVGEGLAVHEPGLSAAGRRARIIEALEDVGLDEAALNRYPHEFSGGQRQRIAIARAVILRPRIVILDEPTSALDATVQRQVLELLNRLQQEHGMSYLFITHDLAVVRAVAHRVLVLYEGRVVETGPTEQIFTAPVHDYTRRLVSSVAPAA